MSTEEGFIDVIAFDFGNVIHWFDYDRFYRLAAQASSLSADEIRVILTTGDRPPIVELECGHISEADYLSLLQNECRIDLDEEQLIDIFVDIFYPNDYVVRLVDHIQSRYRTALLSNMDAIHFKHYVRHHRIVQRFETTVFSFEVGSMKPDPRPFQVLLDRISVEPKRCVYVDDRPENLHTANEFGFRTILYEPATDLEAALKKHHIYVSN